MQPGEGRRQRRLRRLIKLESNRPGHFAGHWRQPSGRRATGRAWPIARQQAVHWLARGTVGSLYRRVGNTSKSLDTFNGFPVTVAVTMGCGDYGPMLPAERREDWNIPDPKELPAEVFRRVRELIEEKVMTLLASLLSSTPEEGKPVQAGFGVEREPNPLRAGDGGN